VALDLPPGVAAAGGRRTLNADVEYAVQTGAGGRDELRSLSNADGIVTPLASVAAAAGEAGEPTPQPEVQENGAAAEPPPAAPAPPPVIRRPAPPPPREAAKPRPPERKTTTAAATPAKRPAAPKPTAPAASQPAPAAVAVARPSFNCRYARTAGEIAVCGDPGLAALDRQMSAQFYRSLSVARPGQRALLQRSRNRFLRYRDSCGSNACIAEAYRGRMREIADIMTGGY
jgi:outer membrane biosynthesis protein TonB